uniref:Uncharacterized protein n=1 Tax=Romanomermis culicivorax TaxID=13658 RepID=A0A915L0N2_ROMCU
SINEKPINVDYSKEKIIWQRLYPESLYTRKFMIDMGDYLGISEHRGMFDKGYLPQWSEEVS